MTNGVVRQLSRNLGERKALALAFPLVLTVALGAADYATGHEIAITSFYLLPICWASWVAGRGAGLLLAGASASAWLIADVVDQHTYAHPGIPYWNALMLLVLFMVVVYLLSAFHDAHSHLEETVTQRTAALRQEIAERKRLEAANIQAERLAVVGTMAAQVAHEVRNPLGSIALNLDLIQEEVETLAGTSQHSPEEGHLFVNEMRAEVRRIQQVLEDYLHFARMSKPKRRPLALNEFLGQKLAFMQSEFEQADVKLRTAFSSSLTAMVEADGEQLWQATLNLVRNSIEAMPEGGELAVSTWSGNTHVVVQVSDSGKGMTAEQLKQIFAPFYTTKTSGTGLGLALVQQIISEHGGRVECESAPGKGSTFNLFLPLTENS